MDGFWLAKLCTVATRAAITQTMPSTQSEEVATLQRQEHHLVGGRADASRESGSGRGMCHGHIVLAELGP